MKPASQLVLMVVFYLILGKAQDQCLHSEMLLSLYGSSQDILEPVTPEQINTVNLLYPSHITVSGIELHLHLRKNKNIYCCL